MTTRAEVSELTVVLKELRDLINQQGALLETLVHGGKNRVDSEKLPQNLSQTDEAADQIKGAPDSSEEESNNADADDLNSLLRHWHPWPQDRIALYRTSSPYSWWTQDAKVPQGLKVEARAPQPLHGVIGDGWKYWSPLLQKEENLNRPTDDQFRGYIDYRPGGRPDFVPPWELCRVGEVLFHVDDIERRDPLPLSGWAGEAERSLVPYSFMPPVPTKFWRQTPRIAATGITVDWDRLHNRLGDLYSVPPDGRLPLMFERNELRLKCASQHDITLYLNEVHELFESIDQVIGEFTIYDIGEHGRHNNRLTRYSPRAPMEAVLANMPSYWKAAGPALLRERIGLRVCPSHIPFKTQHFSGENGVHDKDQDIVYPSVYLIRKPLRQNHRWYRLIYLEGLSSVFASKEMMTRDSTHTWKLLFDESRIGYAVFEAIEDVVRLHLSCSREQRLDMDAGTRWTPFHITWTEVFERKPKSSSWTSGPYYGSRGKLYMRETALTFLWLLTVEDPTDFNDPVDFCPNRAVRSDNDFWTLLLLAPQLSVQKVLTEYQVPATYVLDIIEMGLETAANAWAATQAHFDSILHTRDTTFSPQRHDELLFDDDTFSRSRLYFWAIDSLDLYISQIEATIKEWDNFWAARQATIEAFQKIQYRRDHETLEGFEPSTSALDKVKRQISRLKHFRAQFEITQKRTLALRDGLFNASSVIESRAATRLGENVKLLTYVSIFYLPLAFCASLWSIDEGFNKSTFAATSVLVGLGTYLCVANLENSFSTLRSIYAIVKQPIVERMATDDDPEWALRGERFRSFQPRRETVKPSEWQIARFSGLEILRILRLAQRPGDTAGASDSNESESRVENHSRSESQTQPQMQERDSNVNIHSGAIDDSSCGDFREEKAGHGETLRKFKDKVRSPFRRHKGQENDPER